MRSGFFSGKPPYPGKLELAGEYTRAAQRHRAVGCLDRGATPVEHTEASRGVGALGGGEMPEELFSGNPSLADLEKRYIERTLEQSGWRIEGKRGALAVLRISRSALYDKMRRYGVKRPF